MNKKRLGEQLVDLNVISAEELELALEYHRRWGRRIGESLIRLGFLDEGTLVEVLSQAFKVPMIQPEQVSPETLPHSLLKLVPLVTARKLRLIPIGLRTVQGQTRLIVASSDPSQTKLEDVSKKAGYPLVMMICKDSSIDWFIRRYYLGEQELSLNYISQMIER